MRKSLKNRVGIALLLLSSLMLIALPVAAQDQDTIEVPEPADDDYLLQQEPRRY